jgi:L-lactate dehydrogenase complex protein LldG
VDTSDARQKILARIRRAHGRSAAPTPEELAAADDYVARHGRAPGPTVGEDVLAHFETQAQRMSSTTERVERLADVPAAVAASSAPTGCRRRPSAGRRSRASTGPVPG